ncbi:MAG: hypothetical protein ACK551_03975 [Vampirovibrionales bacterium]
MINIGSPSVTALETSPTRSTLSLNNNPFQSTSTTLQPSNQITLAELANFSHTGASPEDLFGVANGLKDLSSLARTTTLKKAGTETTEPAPAELKEAPAVKPSTVASIDKTAPPPQAPPTTKTEVSAADASKDATGTFVKDIALDLFKGEGVSKTFADLLGVKSPAEPTSMPQTPKASLVPGMDNATLGSITKTFSLGETPSSVNDFLVNPLGQVNKVMKGQAISEGDIFAPVNDGLARDAGLDPAMKAALAQEREANKSKNSQFGNTPYASVNLKKQAFLELARHDPAGALALQAEAVKKEEKKAAK